ncbi:unnamed protein product [Rotaria sordida]|uniref:Uncharacterized protein n=1 Tax=Rotaria sordida TaxID=392033 RepID=A0A813NJA6_9BILA|nr:unnamed protein product [Rotaria sordida]CAF0809329.1 unnamed protein product [Rotaria sordida]CAF0825495.1 unnamed protein product [Rotaria sordida]CAF0844705.1 unnamed protein product [Rotaria sordida]CAF0863374.1 unnamed protein product [Rotaria sordida]
MARILDQHFSDLFQVITELILFFSQICFNEEANKQKNKMRNMFSFFREQKNIQMKNRTSDKINNISIDIK